MNGVRRYGQQMKPRQDGEASASIYAMTRSALVSTQTALRTTSIVSGTVATAPHLPQGELEEAARLRGEAAAARQEGARSIRNGADGYVAERPTEGDTSDTRTNGTVSTRLSFGVLTLGRGEWMLMQPSGKHRLLARLLLIAITGSLGSLMVIGYHSHSPALACGVVCFAACAATVLDIVRDRARR